MSIKVHSLDSHHVGLIALLVCALASAVCCSNFSNEQGKVLDVLQSELPIPNGFTLVSQGAVSKLSHASSTRRYNCLSPYSEVKTFYLGALEPKGWRLVSEQPVQYRGESYGGCSLVFARDEYQVTVQYAGTPEPEYGWDYAVSVSWE